MRFLKTLSMALLLTFTFAANANAQTFINGIDANYPPFGYVDEKGNPAGFDVEAVNWIAEKMGFEVKHQPMDWDGIIPALLAGKIDMIASGMSITPERAARVDFSDPYFQLEKVIVGRNDSTLTVEEVFGGDLKLGVQRGTSEHDLLEKKKVDEKLSYQLGYYDSGPLAIEDLVNGRVDAVAMDIFPANDSIAKGKPVKILGVFQRGDQFGVAFRKEDVELRNKINEGYKMLQKDPYWEELKAKHLK